MSNCLSSADRALAQRIEASDASNIVQLLPARDPFACEPAAGGFCVFGGAGNPFTHAVGIGMCGPVEPGELDRIEEFYRSRGVACTIDLCTLADPSLIALIHARPYRPTEFNNVLVRAIDPATDRQPSLARRIGPDEQAAWSRLIAAGFAESDELPESAELADFGAAQCFLADWNGRPAAGGALSLSNGIAWMYGDATLPSARGRGLQSELIRARLSAAAAAGCELAVAAVLPGSGSHRNYARAGFSLVYTRVGVTREFPEVLP